MPSRQAGRTKEGNLRIPLHVGGETQAQSDASIVIATTALPNALTVWDSEQPAVQKIPL
jgi:hypothetical protein